MEVKKDWEKYSMWKKIGLITSAITGIVAVTAIAFAGYDHFHTDSEALSAATLNETQRLVISSTHQTDRRTDAEVRKSDRLDRVERELKRIRLERADPNIAEWREKQLLIDKDEWDDKVECIRDDTC